MPSSTATRRSTSADDKLCPHQNVPLSIIEQEDPDFFKAISSSPLQRIPPPRDIGDQREMRQRVQDIHLRIPREPMSKRIFPPVWISVEDIPIVHGNSHAFSVRVYDPAVRSPDNQSLRPALIMYHGGGWTHGLPEMDEEISKLFSSELRSVIVSVNYRLAPEHTFPYPLDDCYEALNWTLNNAAKYRINRTRIGVWGYSAGGNLAAAVTLRDATENSVSRIKHVNLVVPATCHPRVYSASLKSAGASSQKFGTGKNSVIPLSAMQKLWDTYAPTDPSSPYTSILHAVPPKNHPSVHVTVCGRDTLRDEGIAYALHLRDHGVDTQLEIIPGVPHEIDLVTASNANRQYLTNQVRVLNYALNTDF